MNAGGCLSEVYSLADQGKLHSHEAAPDNPHVSHMKAPALLTSGKKGVNKDRRQRREAQVPVLSLNLEDYGSRAVCKALQPGCSCHRCWEEAL